jgi:3-deoxy-7-phosphoheptulonate synthase
MLHATDDLRIEGIHPLLPPQILIEELPLTEAASAVVRDARVAAEKILRGEDQRLVVVLGPCSVHDPKAALEYAALVAKAQKRFASELQLVMRVYFEKPRTTVGWKGLINDPNLDGSFAINKGLRIARQLLLDIAALGVPSATEFVDTITPQFIADLVAWAAIGARTTESPVHRQLASGLSMPVGFKNGTDGNVQIAIDAIRSVRDKHHFLSVTKQGLSAIVATRGNDMCHVILRGSRDAPNFSAEHVAAAAKKLESHGLRPNVMIDCSHGNSNKSHDKQIDVAQDIAAQVGGGNQAIFGVMIESNLVAGKQDAQPGKPLVYGQSVTDACIDWGQTEPLLEALARAVVDRRR